MDYFSEKIEEARQRIPTMEHMLGKGLMQPFNNTNSGSRKLMYSVFQGHSLPLLNGEKAIIETGYEIRFGDLSSSVLATDTDYRVVKKISKFSFVPNHHYFLIVEDPNSKKLDIITRISYQPITESYGYLNNNQYLDTLSERDIIPKDTIVQKSMAFDEYNNRKDGANFNVVYLSLDLNMEDSVIMSEDAAKRLAAPLLKGVSIMVNENDIPLNLYGNNDIFKCFPDIGEDIKNGTLIALRREKKEEIPYTESVENLQRKFMSDEKKLLKGKVIDVDIYVNNPDNLSLYHNGQFKMYYDEVLRMSQEFVTTCTQYEMAGYEFSYALQRMYTISKWVLAGVRYGDNKKPYSNIMLEFMIMEELPMLEGDKSSNRYGGKGVVSKIWPKWRMPKFGKNKEEVDIIYNMFTMNNRKNPGQSFEVHINHISHEICNQISSGNYTIAEAIHMIEQFLEIVVPEQRQEFSDILSYMDEGEKIFFIESIVRSGNIQISSRPISDSFDIDRLMALYQTFPFVDNDDLYVMMKDSNGNFREVKARRKTVVAREYVTRLKQIAGEKFSATSLSATNLRGENTKSKANKNWNIMFPNTPIRCGNMEINNQNHLGIEVVMENLMIHSVSPEARKDAEQLYTGNPYEINIRLSKNARNIMAEITATYLKAMGRRVVFRKVPKKRVVPFVINPFEFVRPPVMEPFRTIEKDVLNDPNFDLEEHMRINNEIEFGDPSRSPFVWTGNDPEVTKERERENRVAQEQRHLNPREIYNKYYKHTEES